MELEECQFMGETLMMKVSGYPMQLKACFQWQMLVQIQMGHSSSLPSERLLILMESTPSLDELFLVIKP